MIDLAALRERIDPQPNRFHADPVGWVAETTGEFLWSKQREVMEALRDHKKVAVTASHGPGKSFTAARAVAWWVDTHNPHDTRVATTAPVFDQVNNILWKEVRDVHRLAGGKLAGKVQADPKWRIGDKLVAFGRSPEDTNEHAFQGIHDRYVLVVLDEACGVHTNLWVAADAIAVKDDDRILAIGNPTDPTSHFARVCEGAPEGESGLSKLGWWVIRISTFDTPLFTGEKVPEVVAVNMPTPSWQQEQATTYGEDSPLYQARVLGRFPDDATDGVIPWSWLQRCRQPLDESGPIELGLDPAGEGTDHAVCWLRVGPRAVRKWSWPYTPDPGELARLVCEVIVETGAESIKIDADGLGWGISGILDEMAAHGKHRCVSIPVRGQAAPQDPDQFFNTRSETWWAGRERSRLGLWDLTALDDSDLQDLSVPRYHTRNPKARIQIEKKEELKRRLGRSPDSGDALLLAFHEPAPHDEMVAPEVEPMRLPKINGVR